MEKIQRPKGTQDIFGKDASRWQAVESCFRKIMRQAHYQEIRTPAFEYTELFKRGVGETTDIVNKEMYTFEKGERSLTLRPEGTAGVVRSYVEQGMSRWPKPVKLYYMGPMFRYERPQAGRQRQFHQMGLELFGLDTPEADAEAISLAMDFFGSLELPNLALEVNNIGTAQCREVFKQGFQTLVTPYLAKLCQDCQNRFHSNPLRMLDCKIPADKEIYDLPEIKSFLEKDFTSDECQAHFAKLSDILSALEIPFKRNYRLVRGLDYYTKTVFEITSTHLGAQNAVCGGGRYNNLVEQLGGPATPAVGWALGMERLVSLLGDLENAGLDYYIVSDQPEYAFKVAKLLRAKNLAVEVNLSGKNFGKQFETAAKSGAPKILVLGEAEAKNQQVTVKIMADASQNSLSLRELLGSL
ncbi:MAG: histidine--tRNA ligase [Vampirovibrionales bacterium]|nr:histidine--tRNA ligase [Vampirovibrionales bacterium]